MAKIRVSVSNLKSNSKKIFDSASDLQKISCAVQNAANSAPSYNGQFGPRVKAIGNAMYSKGMQQSYELQDKAGDLKSRAEKFENADRKSILLNFRNLFNNLFGNNKYLQNLFGSLFKPAMTSVHPTINPLSDSVNEIIGNNVQTTKRQNQQRPSSWKEIIEIQEKIKEDRKRYAIEQGLPSNWKDSWYEKWYDHNCPPVGTDAYLGFLSQCYTSFNYPIAIIKNGDEYCVFIRGTDGDYKDWDASPDDDENCWGNNIPAFEGRQTGYELSVLNLIRSSIPKGSKINLVGHSQGGIIANNCVADLINEFNVNSVLTFGAPPPINFDLPDTIKRRYYGDIEDPVVNWPKTVYSLAAVKHPFQSTEIKKKEAEKYGKITYIESGNTLFGAHDIHAYTCSSFVQKRKSSFATNGELEFVSHHKRQKYNGDLVMFDKTLSNKESFISWSGDIVNIKKENTFTTHTGSSGGSFGSASGTHG